MKKKRDKNVVVHLFLISAVIFLALSFMSAGCVIEFTHWKPGPGPHYCAIKQLNQPEGSDVIGCVKALGNNEADCLAYEKYGNNGGHYWRSGDPANDPECINCMGFYQLNDLTYTTFFSEVGDYNCGDTNSQYKNLLYQCKSFNSIDRTADCNLAGGICNKDLGRCDLPSDEEPADASILVWIGTVTDFSSILMYNFTSNQWRYLLPGENHGSVWNQTDGLFSVYNDKIVYRKLMHTTYDHPEIFEYSLTTQMQRQITNITKGKDDGWNWNHHNTNPDIYKNIIVWSSESAGKSCYNGQCYADIWMCDLTPGSANECGVKERAITIYNPTQYIYNNNLYPTVYGNNLVYLSANIFSYSTDIWNLTVYNLVTGQNKTIGATNTKKWGHAIYGNTVVWDDYRNGNWDIYVHDLSNPDDTSERQITNNPADQQYPWIYKNLVVWEDYRNCVGSVCNYDIYMCDLKSGNPNECGTNDDKRITTFANNQILPSIFGTKITWSDQRGGIWAYDLITDTETAVINNGNYGTYSAETCQLN